MPDISGCWTRLSGRRRAGGVAAAVLAAWLVGWASVSGGQEVDETQLRPILDEMAARKAQFDADRLHRLGLEGLRAMLDYLLPETAEPKPLGESDEAIARWIAQLGHESYAEREMASRELVRLGPAVTPHLVAATKHPDAETSWRATRILRQWESERQENKNRYLPAFTAYAGGISDKPRLDELLRRVLLMLESGPPANDKQQVLRQAMAALTRAGRPEHLDALGPLLDHANVQVAVLVVSSVGQGAAGLPPPGLMLDALRSERVEVVNAALTHVMRSPEGPERDAVRDILIERFQGDNENVKFRLGVTLWQGFEWPEARDYLLEEAQQGDRSRQYQALGALASPRNQPRPADEKLVEGLSPLLESADMNVRRMAMTALASHSGEAVVRRLIPLLGDAQQFIAQEAARRLATQPDKDMLRRLLAEAAEDESQPKVREEAKKLLGSLGG
jgi:HEAT repeat protein